MNLIGYSPNGLGVANGTIVMALLDHLLADGVLRPRDVRTILNKAVAELEPRQANVAVKDAISIIRVAMLPRFEKGIKKD